MTLWYAGDVEALFAASIEDMATLEDPALLQDTLFDRRNAAMTKALLPLLKSGKTTFAMVGAGHLGGPKGMLAGASAGKATRPSSSPWEVTPAP